MLSSVYIGTIGRWYGVSSLEEAYQRYKPGDMFLMYRSGRLIYAGWATVLDRNEKGDPIMYLQTHTNWK